MDKRHADRRHELLVRGHNDDRVELGQCQVISYWREHHQQFKPILLAAMIGAESTQSAPTWTSVCTLPDY